jgi:CheY-like chemotaxis protein
MLKLLLIEDSEDDAFLLSRALDREQIRMSFKRVQNGDQAIRYLQGDGEYSNRDEFPFPNIIFTDLKMPGMDGFSILSWLKKHPQCQLLPTMVFTSSSNEKDVERAYHLGANAYLVKPNSISELQKLVRSAHEFWKNCRKAQVRLN